MLLFALKNVKSFIAIGADVQVHSSEKVQRTTSSDGFKSSRLRMDCMVSCVAIKVSNSFSLRALRTVKFGVYFKIETGKKVSSESSCMPFNHVRNIFEKSSKTFNSGQFNIQNID